MDNIMDTGQRISTCHRSSGNLASHSSQITYCLLWCVHWHPSCAGTDTTTDLIWYDRMRMRRRWSEKGRTGWRSECVWSAYDEVCMAKKMSWSIK